MLLSILALGACSQNQQNEKGAVVGSNTGNGSVTNRGTSRGGSRNSGPTSGTIGRGGASSVNSRDGSGNRSNSGNGKSGGGRGGSGGSANNANDISLAGLNDPNNLLSQRIIYFDYDKASIRPEYMILINTHAELLAKHPNLKMRLEGHADERGSREYNVALSESRAQSVKSIMGIQGAIGGQIKTIGYGEELPVVKGHNQKSWQKNRRVEIKYDNY